MARVFNPEYCSIETENLILSIAQKTGFASLAIADLYDSLRRQDIFTPELLGQIAQEADKASLPLPKEYRRGENTNAEIK